MKHRVTALGACVTSLVIAAPAHAAPQEDQFLSKVMMYLSESYQPSDEDMVVGMGHSICYMLNEGYDGTETMRQVIYAAPWTRAVVSYSIGFALVATQVFCPEYSRTYAGV
jgi:hypothetical protein